MFGDTYFYWRQFNPTNKSLTLKEYVYYFDVDIIPVEISRKELNAADNLDWSFAAIVVNGTNVYLFN